LSFKTVSIHASIRPTPQSQTASAQALYFTSANRQLFAWLHAAPSNTPGRVGVVICKPFGFESMSGHLSIRAFAEAAAEVGVPSLRFDYSGAGDSEDLPAGANQFDAWCQDIEAAILELQRRTGVERVCLLGFRLGALLAASVAERCASVCSLIAIAPTISGRRYVRELKTFELAATARASSHEAPASDAKPASDGDLEAGGFILTAKTLAALQKIDLMQSPVPNLEEALIIDRDDLAGAKAWTERLTTAGVRTHYTALPGFVPMLMRPPNLTIVPLPMVAAAREWLAGLPARLALTDASNAPRPQAVAPITELVLHSNVGATVSERTVVLRSDPLLFGIVTVPQTGEVRRRAVILLNSGCDPHIGPRRLYVSMARDWAKNGYYVLRIDIAGLGDSAERAGQRRNELFPIEATEDAKAAVEYMRTQYGVGDVTLCGICSGASHTIQAAFAGVAVDRVLLVNPLIFYWKPGAVNLDEVQPWEVVHKPGAYFRKIFSMAAWRRLLFGDLSIVRIAQIYLTRPLLAVQARMRDAARAMHIRMKQDLGWDLKDLKARGVRIVFVFSKGDAGLSLLQLESGLSERELRDTYSLRMINGADHEFTRTEPREELARVLSEELYASNQFSVPRSIEVSRGFCATRAAPVKTIRPAP
jgi:alpha-beta hydrolase superfamily lysophospholipase